MPVCVGFLDGDVEGGYVLVRAIGDLEGHYGRCRIVMPTLDFGSHGRVL